MTYLHGTASAYRQDKCRCVDCRAANAAYSRAWHARRSVGVWVPLVGTQRRLRALAADGWSTREIGKRARVDSDTICKLQHRRASRILAVTAAHYRGVFDDLWWRTPTGPRIAYAENRAERNRWAESWRWDGLDIDDPDVKPLPLPKASGWDRQPCGTDAAARRHYRLGEPVDEACRRAMARTAAERRAQRGAA